MGFDLGLRWGGRERGGAGGVGECPYSRVWGLGEEKWDSGEMWVTLASDPPSWVVARAARSFLG